jgi:MOSC domain-containing protein YiiM/ferredoxin-NADP reductase
MEVYACIQSTVLREVRIGKRGLLAASGLISAINKLPVQGPVEIKKTMIVGDEYGAPELHGGEEQVILHYPEDHYHLWRKEFPDRAERMSGGGFGENFVAPGFDETNMCIGDIVTVGSVRFQVSMPRQPCVRLNHRFDLPVMAARVQNTCRTGWYYRVLTPGFVSVNDVMTVVERPHPQWTISKVQHYLYTDTENLQAMTDLAALPELAPLMRNLFARRLDNLSHASEAADNETAGGFWKRLKVEEIAEESSLVRSYLLSSPDGSPLPTPAPGAHIRVRLPDGLTRQYSLCTSRNVHQYRIGVGLAAQSRGGSRWIHESLAVGDMLECSDPYDNFRPAEHAPLHVMFAGGIGVTPFLSMIEHFNRRGQSYHLHYMGRNKTATGFIEELTALGSEHVSMHFTEGDPSCRLDIGNVLASLPVGAHIYCCGSDGMVEAVSQASAHLPPENVHIERFIAPADTTRDQPYSVFLGKRGIWIEAAPGRSLLTSLRKHRVQVPSSCETGSCGSCVVGFTAGTVQHGDSCLSDETRKSCLAVCVSYATSTSITLDL